MPADCRFGSGLCLLFGHEPAKFSLEVLVPVLINPQRGPGEPMRAATVRTAWWSSMLISPDSWAAPNPSNTAEGTSTGSSNLFAIALLPTATAYAGADRQRGTVAPIPRANPTPCEPSFG
jgi:hypothetical protein